MDRNVGTLLFFVIILFVACSNSDNLAGVTTESNDVAKETENGIFVSTGTSSGSEALGGTEEEVVISIDKSSSSSAEVILDVMPDSKRAVLDSILSFMDENNGFAQIHDSTLLPTMSSSKTVYNFMTAGQLYSEQAQCSVRLYEEEYGVQMVGGYHGFLMQTTLVLRDEHVVLQMLSNNYWGGDIVTECRTDSASFHKNCESQSGAFRNYGTGTGCDSIGGGTLQLACAIPVTEKTVVSELLMDEAEMYKQNCKSEPIKVPVCSVVCETGDAGESCHMSCL